MTERIEVAIQVKDYPDNWMLTPSMWECFVVGKLRDAGVPIKGLLKYRGVEKGTITRFDDPKDFGATKYIWSA